MNLKNIQTKFFAAVAASPLVFLAPDIAQADPIVEYTHPAGTVLASGKRTTEPKTVKVDCGKFYRPPSNPKKLFFTPEVATQTDIEGGIASGNITKPIPLTGDETQVINALTQNTQFWFKHLAQYHEQCRAQQRSLVLRYGGEPVPKEWETQTNCPLTEVANMCKAELGLK